MTLPVEELERLHALASRHRGAVEESALIGCFYCLNASKRDDIKEWVDGGATALCPRCGMDAVLPGAVVPTLAVLVDMKEHWFAVVKGEDT